MIRRTLGILLVGNGNGVQGLGGGVFSVARDMVDHFLHMKVWLLVDLPDHTSSFLIRAALSRIIGVEFKVQRLSASWLQQPFDFFFESQRRHFSRSSAAKDDAVCLRIGLSSIDSRGTLVAGPPPSSSFSRQCRDISNFPGAQGSLSKVDSNTLTLMIRKVQKEHVPETESECKTRSNFRALFYRVSRAFGCDQNVHVALVTRGARRSKRNIPHYDYPLVCPCFFPHKVFFTISKPFLQKLFVTRRYQHDSVLELFPHFGRRTIGFSHMSIFRQSAERAARAAPNGVMKGVTFLLVFRCLNHTASSRKAFNIFNGFRRAKFSQRNTNRQKNFC